MKRKYAAIALGLTLALSSTAAFAEETTEVSVATTTAAEATEADTNGEANDASLDSEEKNADTFLGQITEITEDSIKITDSRLHPTPDSEETAAEAANGEDAEDTASEAAEDSTENTEEEAADEDAAFYGILELSPDHTTTVNYSDATSFERLTDPFYLTITDNGMTEAPALEDTEDMASEDTETPASEDAEDMVLEDTEAPASKDAEDMTLEDTEAPASEDTEAPVPEDAEAPEDADIASLIPSDAITEVITADDLQEGDVIYVVLNEDGTAAEITVLASGDTIAAVYSEPAEEMFSEAAQADSAEAASEADSEENSTDAE